MHVLYVCKGAIRTNLFLQEHLTIFQAWLNVGLTGYILSHGLHVIHTIYKNIIAYPATFYAFIVLLTSSIIFWSHIYILAINQLSIL